MSAWGLIDIFVFYGLAPQGCFVALPSLRSEKTLGRVLAPTLLLGLAVLASRFPKSVQMLRIFTEIWHSVVLSSQNTFASTTSTYVRARGARPYGWLRLYNSGSRCSPLRMLFKCSPPTGNLRRIPPPRYQPPTSCKS